MSDFIPSTDIVRTYASQTHYVSRINETRLGAIDTVADDSALSSLQGEARKNPRRHPIFWIALTIVVIALVISAFPSPLTSQDSRFCKLSDSLKGPSNDHPFGFNRQGCDIYSRVICGAHASVSVGVSTTILVVLFGGVIGTAAGYLGGWFNTLLPRITGIFSAISLLLTVVAFMQMFKDNRNTWVVITALSLFGWTQIARVTHDAAISVKNEGFMTAARTTGASKSRILLSHVIPNSVASTIVYATVALSTSIMSEASLSFMGIGLPPEIISWDTGISTAQAPLRTNPMAFFYPAFALALTVLSFVMMGDAVRDALDLKARK